MLDILLERLGVNEVMTVTATNTIIYDRSPNDEECLASPLSLNDSMKEMELTQTDLFSLSYLVWLYPQALSFGR